MKYKNKDKYKELAIKRHLLNNNFGWKSQIIEQLDNFNNVIKEYALEHNCSIGNVGKVLKENNRCKGFYIRYKIVD